MAQTIQITVGDQAHTLPKLGHRRSKGWRKSFEQRLVGLAPKLGVLDPDAMRKVDMTKTENLQQLFSSVFGVVEDALDTALDLVLEYAGDSLNPEATQEHIYDEEIVTAFIKVVRAAIPFDHILSLVRTMEIGQQVVTTSQNSPSLNGESQTTTA